jgi:hypothetical protein
MIGFELFQVNAWVEKGLITRHPPKRDLSSLPPRRSTWKVVAVLSLAASAVTAFDANAGLTQSLMSWNAPSTRIAQSTARSEGEVPVGYWSNLIKEMESWRQLEESSLVPPDPII